MNRFRIGNDINIRWNVKKNGQPAEISDKQVRLFLSHSRGREEVKVFIVEGNVLSWTFEGMDQSVLGRYTFTIDVRKTDGSRYLIQDKCNAMELVGRSEMEDKDTNYQLEL